jgi:hypothetical protein
MGGAPMKNIIITFLILFIGIHGSIAQENSQKLWSSGTAYTIPAHRWETGLFLPLRMGFHSNLEFSTHPLVFCVMPNMSIKWFHGEWRKCIISSRHSVYYPTPLLRILSRKGTGGIISPQFNIPHMISIYNELLLTSALHPEIYITGRVGFCFAVKSASLDKKSTIDLPIVFPRLNVFYNDYGFKSGLGISGRFFKRWYCDLDGDIFYYPIAEEKFAFELTSLVFWRKSGAFQLCTGLKLSYAQYPFGDQWHVLAPLIDLQWGWN